MIKRILKEEFTTEQTVDFYEKVGDLLELLSSNDILKTLENERIEKKETEEEIEKNIQDGLISSETGEKLIRKLIRELNDDSIMGPIQNFVDTNFEHVPPEYEGAIDQINSFLVFANEKNDCLTKAKAIAQKIIGMNSDDNLKKYSRVNQFVKDTNLKSTQPAKKKKAS